MRSIICVALINHVCRTVRALRAESAVVRALRRVRGPAPLCAVDEYAWEENTIRCACDGPEGGPPLLLLHGFGSSLETWRDNVPALAEAGYRCHRLDLLGLGLSEKAPGAYPLRRFDNRGDDLHRPWPRRRRGRDLDRPWAGRGDAAATDRPWLVRG